MMDENKFKIYLKRGGRAENVAQKALFLTRQFDQYLGALTDSKNLDTACAEDLMAYVDWVERTPGKSAKTHLWALCYYYEFAKNEEMHGIASTLRQARIDRSPFPLKGFSGIEAATLEQLAALGIKNTGQMLEAGQTQQKRQSLSEQTGIPPETIIKLVKLSDLTRIPGVKDTRARLYYAAGVDSVEKMAEWEPEALREMIVDFVEESGFDGIPTLQKEAIFTILSAKKLPIIIQY